MDYRTKQKNSLFSKLMIYHFTTFGELFSMEILFYFATRLHLSYFGNKSSVYNMATNWVLS